jgi:hypothetical protein
MATTKTRRLPPAPCPNRNPPQPSRSLIGVDNPDAVPFADGEREFHGQEGPNPDQRDQRTVTQRFDEFAARLDRIEAAVRALTQQRTAREWYTTSEVAEELGKVEYTVREWCRNERVNAEKKGSGRGRYQSWVISHEELLRIRREGLLPLRRG